MNDAILTVTNLRLQIMIIDFKLTYPSGTAIAHLINSFHIPQGAKLAKKQVRVLGNSSPSASSVVSSNGSLLQEKIVGLTAFLLLDSELTSTSSTLIYTSHFASDPKVT